jgi:hypothetical protein
MLAGESFRSDAWRITWPLRVRSRHALIPPSIGWLKEGGRYPRIPDLEPLQILNIKEEFSSQLLEIPRSVDQTLETCAPAFHSHYSANKQYHPFRANHGFCEVRFASMSGHRETQSSSPKSANGGSRGGLIDYDRLRGHVPTLDGGEGGVHPCFDSNEKHRDAC